ncbi:MAG: DUF362 domain-containing protein [Chloroflexi bacterium]|nr:DUF362 domain-containing protein [Chloroflexota bacterium]MBT7080010.1 DUF362 domain-containing protein [Chloroflexota bacterium]MBT7289857.1 DUF362 domain-containing protein [Chloroflexota bacterium]
MKSERAKIALVRAGAYKCDELSIDIDEALDLIGGLSSFVPPQSKVFVKINHLPPPSVAEKCIVTNPVFVEAVVTLLKAITTDITVGDDIDSGPPDGFEVSGIRQACDRAGVKLINLREEGFIEKSDANNMALDKTYISKAVLESDVIINLPKMKTHSLAVFTGAVKNMYGVLPGGIRRRYHADYMARVDFNQMLVDVFSQVRPHLNIMDGIMAMEGEGPAGGSPRKVGVVLAGADAVALDAVATTIIGIDPMDVRTLKYAAQRGLGVADLGSIDVVGQAIDDVKVLGFKHPASSSGAAVEKAPRFLAGFVVKQLDVKPSVKKVKCTGCAECAKVCPVHAIKMSSKIAKINDSMCIKCLCCHEVCRYDAIVRRQSFGGRLLAFLGKTMQRAFNKS